MNKKSSTSPLADRIAQIVSNHGEGVPPKHILDDIEVIAGVSKLVNSRLLGDDPLKEASKGNTGLLASGVTQISENIKERVRSNRNTLSLFPDIELASQILVSSISSPKDMLSQDITYLAEENRIPGAVLNQMCSLVKDAMTKHYKLQDDLQERIRVPLFQTGSYVTLILPESAVDGVINGSRVASTEDIYSPEIFDLSAGSPKIRDIGYLGKIDNNASVTSTGRIHSIESIISGMTNGSQLASFVKFDDSAESESNKLLEVTDNFLSLKIPALVNSVRERASQAIINSYVKTPANLAMNLAYSAESATYELGSGKLRSFNSKERPTVQQMQGMLYKQPTNDVVPYVEIPSSINAKRKSIGRPMVLRVPSEAVIPVHKPGNPEEHIGYFLLTDADNNFVTADDSDIHTGESLEGLSKVREGGGNSLGSILTERAKRNLDADAKAPLLTDLKEVYAGLVERDLLERLRRGIAGNSAAISKVNEIYEVMFFRHLKSQFTRIVYVPAEFVNYFAFDYHPNGVGRSNLDDLASITSLRAIVMFSRIWSMVKSSVAVTKVNVKLDPRDPDPRKTIATSKDLISQTRTQMFPHGLSRTTDITDWLQKASVQMYFTGHPMIPDTSLEMENVSVPHEKPDAELEKSLQEMSWMHFGITPEVMNAASGSDFATTVEQNGVLFAQRVMVKNKKACVNMTDLTQKLVRNDMFIYEGLLKIVKENDELIRQNFTDEDGGKIGSEKSNDIAFAVMVVEEFIKQLRAKLPEPDSTRVDNLKKAYDNKRASVEAAVKEILSNEALPEEVIGPMSGSIEAVSKMWVSSIMRDWMAKNNYENEVFEFINRDADGKNLIDVVGNNREFIKSVSMTVLEQLKSIQNIRNAIASDIKKMNEAGANIPTDGSGSSSSSSDFGGSDNNGSGGDDGFGGGFGGDFADAAGGDGSQDNQFGNEFGDNDLTGGNNNPENKPDDAGSSGDAGDKKDSGNNDNAPDGGASNIENAGSSFK